MADISVKQATCKIAAPSLNHWPSMFNSFCRHDLRRGATFVICLICALVGGTNADAANAALPYGCELANATPSIATDARAAPPIFPPVQLQVRTSVEPTVLPSDGKNYLIYELHLHNFSTEPLTVQSIEVLDADRPTTPVVAGIKGKQLGESLRKVTIGEHQGSSQQLGVGEGAVAFLCLAFDATTPVPLTLRHRIRLDQSVAEGSPIKTHATPLHVLGRPLVGANWTPDNNPSLYSHHRMGLWVVGGDAGISRRYAIDWKKYDDEGKTYAGDPRDVHSYYAYGQKVLAVADGTVVEARDGFPDNIPKTEAGFDPARPVTLDTIGGNQVIIDVGGGQFAAYFHLQPGSIAVKAGDRVRRGQPVGRIGNSGDARWPHLHFQVTDKADAMASEGLPHVFDSYRVQTGNQQWKTRTAEYPMGRVVIDFGADTVIR